MKFFCKICQSHQECDKNKCCSECGANLKEATIAPSTVIAGFKIVKEIGRGSNGIVYLAEQTSLDRKVALKILPDIKAEDPNFVKDFLKEARAAARLNYPSIIQVYDAGVTNDGVYFLAMELIDGKSLEEMIQSKGAIKSKNAIKIMLEVAKALEYSWKKEHLFHGDIKPDNIMISKDGKTKLADFGLAKTIYDEKSEEIMATPMYAPPEVIRAEHKNIGFRSDMYSFGVTLYEALAGTPPFNEGDCQKVLYMHLQQHHTPLIEKMPETDRSISDLIDKLLSKNLKKRPQSWGEIVESLEAFKTKKTDLKLKSRLIAGVSAALIIIILAVAASLYYNKEKEPPKLVRKLVIPKKTKIKKAPKIIVKPAPKVPIVKKDDESHLEFKSILKSVEDIKGDILSASRLKFQALKLQNNNSLSKIEQSELIASITKIDNYILQKQKETSKNELADLDSALKKEKIISEKRLAKISKQNSLSARQNKIFKIVSKLFAK
jgi:serine/threonine protein kinase